jgi:hypothetical protein
MSKKFYLLAVIVVLFSAAFASAQSREYEAAVSSSLTDVSLPSGALRVLPNHVPAEIDQTLEKIVSAGEGKLRRGNTEMLLWTGSDLKKVGAVTITNRLTDTLRVAGWKYEVGGTENGITIFTVLKDGANKRAIIGFYGEADGTFVFAWTEAHASAEQNSAAASADLTVGDASGYEFATPAGWSRSDSAGKIVLSKGDDKFIAFLPLMDSSGDLEQDANRLIWQVFKGHNTWYGNGFTPDYGTFEKGKTAQGLEYFRVYRYGKKASDPQEGFVESRFDAVILLVKLGNKVAVIAGRSPFQSDNHDDSAVKTLDLMLYDLKFKGVSNAYNLKNEVVGSWSAASTTVALAYTFNPNGTFNKGGAIQFRTSRDRYTDNVTTTSYGMTDAYNVAGNILTQNYKRTGQVSKFKVRVYQTKYDKDPWQNKMGFLPVANPDGGTIVLTRSN